MRLKGPNAFVDEKIPDARTSCYPKSINPRVMEPIDRPRRRKTPMPSREPPPLVLPSMVCSWFPITASTNPVWPCPPPIVMTKTMPGLTELGSSRAASRLITFRAVTDGSLPQVDHPAGTALLFLHRVGNAHLGRCGRERPVNEGRTPRLASINPHTPLVNLHLFSAIAPRRLLQHPNLARCHGQDLRQPPPSRNRRRRMHRPQAKQRPPRIRADASVHLQWRASQIRVAGLEQFHRRHRIGAY